MASMVSVFQTAHRSTWNPWPICRRCGIRMLRHAACFSWQAIVVGALVLGAATQALGDEVPGPTNEGVEEAEFTERVLPLLREHCFDCHSHESGESSGQLMLDSLAAMTSGGTRGASVVPGKPADSPLVMALEYNNTELQMPPDGKLPAADIDTIRKWVASGAHVPPAMRGTPREKGSKGNLAESHWAYQLPKAYRSQAATLETESSDGSFSQVGTGTESATHQSRGLIDTILLEQLQAAELGYSPRADRVTLLRRVYYALVGLPPSMTEVEQFVQDPRSDRVVLAAAVDDLLASPHFGERWARYWMDVARYADNKGYVFQEDREYPEAYKYRDWLIDAFNRDLPYDEFVAQQLAADLLENPEASDKAGEHSNLPALGFLTLGRRFLNNKNDIIDDRLDVVTRGLMGMTLACARCHDHKYDPISQADYYSMFGVFLNTEEPGGEPWPHRLQESEKNRDSFILIRGSAGNRGEKVERRFVSFLAPEAPAFKNGSGRAELAQQITAPENPLTARVIANRVWMHLVGTSLVESPSDFGTRCPPPKQLALLDQLAIDLVDHGWSLKSLIREIVLTDFYAQQSLDRPDAAAVDPANDLYWRMNRRRLDFEALRDTLLSRSGSLDKTLHGKPQKIQESSTANRRTIYAYIDRQNLPSVFRTFDMASPDAHSPRRPQTSVPQQGLFLLNSDFIADHAESLAAKVRGQAESQGRPAAIRWMFEFVLGRSPTSEELTMFDGFVQQASSETNSPPIERWICGYASFDPETQSLADFRRLPQRVNDSWQGGEKLPDEVLGWCMLNSKGGHVGNDLEHAVVRRWIAPRDGELKISGKLKHPATEGDGVRGTIIAADRSVGSWTVKSSETNTVAEDVEIKEGQFVDFVTDCYGNLNHDSFEWSVQIRYESGSPLRYQSQKEHPDPIKKPLDAWAQAIQVLLASNELAFVD